MKRLFAHPAMSGFVLLAWLLLNQSVAPGHLLLGAVFGLSASAVLDRLQPPALRVRNRLLLLALVGRVAWDIVHANLVLMGLILSGRARRVRSGFLNIPLELSDPYGLAALACIITSTPGTIWVNYEIREGILLIHVFDLGDEEETWIRNIKERYERPLREIFE